MKRCGHYLMGILATFALASTTGCSLIRLGMTSSFARCYKLAVPTERTTRASFPEQTDAGVAKVDITPPPGYPTGGDGMAGGLARGHWTRLYSRAFFFEENGRHLLLIANDLFQIPDALHTEVAARLADRGVRPDEIILTATHTHQGPGNFTSAAVYNEFGSAWMGFSRELFEFLAGRMTEAARIAIDSARSSPSDVRISLRQGSGPDVFMNRAPHAFLLNPDRDRLMQQWNADLPSSAAECIKSQRAGDPGGHWDLEGCPRLRAIDRTISLLEIFRGSSRIGGLLFFALHPTVLHHEAALYSADFSGELVGTLERRWKEDGADEPVVGFFNGAEGDIVPRRSARDILDVGVIAGALVNTIEALPQGIPVSLNVDVYHDSIEAAGASCAGADSKESRWKLATKPTFGVATLGGGEGDRTILYDLGWRESAVGPGHDGQGPKVAGLDSTVVRELRLSDGLAPTWKYPSRLALSYGHIGPLAFVAVPVEMTTLAGWRVREALSDTGDARSVVILGLANGYSSYVATGDEYLEQDYIGASTIWGPQEADFIACEALGLKRSRAAPSETVAKRSFSIGAPPEKQFGPAFLGEGRQDPLEGNFSLFTDRSGRPARDLPTFEWVENASALRPKDGKSPDFQATSRRTVRILERMQPDTWKVRIVQSGPEGDIGADDDKGFNLVTVLMDGSQPGTQRWATVWLRPLRGPIEGEFRFEVTEANSRQLLSAPFICRGDVCASPRRLHGEE